MVRAWAPLAGLLFTLLASPAHGATLDAAPAGALWIADARGVIKIDSRRAQVLLEVREAPGTRALTVDPEAGVLWAYSPGDLRAVDLSGRPLFAVPVPAGAGGTSAGRPAAVAAGGRGSHHQRGRARRRTLRRRRGAHQLPLLLLLQARRWVGRTWHELAPHRGTDSRKPSSLRCRGTA